MIGLTTVTEENWIEISKLSVNDEQQKFLDRTIGIIARGYVYRYCNGRVVAITNDDQIVGVALIRDLDEEPACYDLQQFMIDQRFQNKGYGTEGLKKILSILDHDPKHIDEIALLAKTSTADCLVNLLTLEFKGLVKQLPGKMFVQS